MITGSRAPLVLYRAYDIAQYWLPFVDSVIFEAATEEPVDVLEQHLSSLYKLLPRAKQKYARLPMDLRLLYVYQAGVHQYVLPFSEARRVSKKEFDRLNEAGFPAWDRTTDGTLITVEVSRAKLHEALQWVEEHCKGRYKITKSNTKYVFERSTEAALFKMQFSLEWES